jgi:hypothetical protein
LPGRVQGPPHRILPGRSKWAHSALSSQSVSQSPEDCFSQVWAERRQVKQWAGKVVPNSAIVTYILRAKRHPRRYVPEL